MVYGDDGEVRLQLVPGEGQLYWCTADIGWITGHSYIVYGIMPNRVPTLMYEGAEPPSRTGSGTSSGGTGDAVLPPAIRAFMKWGDEARHEARSLEPAGARHGGRADQPRGVDVVSQRRGRGECPIVDTYWQTETGGHMITPLPGDTDQAECTAAILWRGRGGGGSGRQ